MIVGLAVKPLQVAHVCRIGISLEHFLVFLLVVVTVRTPTQAEVQEIEYLDIGRQRSDQTFARLCILVFILLP